MYRESQFDHIEGCLTDLANVEGTINVPNFRHYLSMYAYIQTYLDDDEESKRLMNESAGPPKTKVDRYLDDIGKKYYLAFDERMRDLKGFEDDRRIHIRRMEFLRKLRATIEYKMDATLSQTHANITLDLERRCYALNESMNKVIGECIAAHSKVKKHYRDSRRSGADFVTDDMDEMLNHMMLAYRIPYRTEE